MKTEIDVPSYDRNQGFVFHWENDFRIWVHVRNGEIILRANKAGLRSLAVQLLTLAQDNVPAGTHIQFDPGTSLEDDSVNFICERIEGNALV